MSLPSWPVGVPFEPIQGSWSMPKRVLSPEPSEMEGGNVRVRRRPGDNVSTIEFTIKMTKAEFELLDEWYIDDCAGGTSRFLMKVWLGFGTEYVEKTVMFDLDYVLSVNEEGPYVGVPMKLRVYR